MTALIRGIAAAPGVAIGPVFVLDGDPEQRSGSGPLGSPSEERERLYEALREAGSQIDQLAARVEREIGAEEAGIFVAQAAFTSDPALIRRAEVQIDGGASAERGVEEAFQSFRRELESSSNEYLAARVADLDDVRDRLIGLLTGRPQTAGPGVASVVVAFELTPSQTAGFERELVLAIATERGTATSHAAILARALGIPSVVGAAGVVAAAHTAKTVGVDGRAGEVLFDPDDATRRRLEADVAAATVRHRQLARLRSMPGATSDGRRVELAANIGALSEVEAAVEAGAEGSGLVRTEFLFQDRAEPPSVEEQVDVYCRILAGFDDHRVVFRTLDIGADKPVPFISREPEANPALGVRGIRLGLRRPDLLSDQLRAVVRSCSGEFSGRGAVMFPMVASAVEIEAALAMLAAVAAEEGADHLEVGAMIETPVAALTAGRMARSLDFVSVGTNDLLQYLYAADRLQPELTDLPDLFEPAVLGLLGRVVADVHGAGGWAGVCGEVAGTVAGAAVLVGLGFDELSMAASAIPEVKDALRRIRSSVLEDAAARAIAAPDAATARRVIESALD